MGSGGLSTSSATATCDGGMQDRRGAAQHSTAWGSQDGGCQVAHALHAGVGAIWRVEPWNMAYYGYGAKYYSSTDSMAGSPVAHKRFPYYRIRKNMA